MAKPIALITGLNGFTGHYIAHALATSGFEIIGLSDKSAKIASKTYNVDLKNAEKVSDIVAQVNPHIVVHLAAISFVAHGDASEIYHTNVVGTRNLLSALSANSKRLCHVVLASSANIYGNNASGLPLTEDVQAKPENDYAVSKYAMEMMANLWIDKLPITVVRPFNYTGVGQTDRFLIPKIVNHFAHKASVIELGNINVARDFGDVRDVAKVYEAICSRDYVGGAYNICTGVETSLQAVIKIMEKLAGYEIQVDVNPNFVRDNEVKSLTGSPLKTFKVFETKKAFDLEDTLSWMYQTARQQ